MIIRLSLIPCEFLQDGFESVSAEQLANAPSSHAALMLKSTLWRHLHAHHKHIHTCWAASNSTQSHASNTLASTHNLCNCCRLARNPAIVMFTIWSLFHSRQGWVKTSTHHTVLHDSEHDINVDTCTPTPRCCCIDESSVPVNNVGMNSFRHVTHVNVHVNKLRQVAIIIVVFKTEHSITWKRTPAQTIYY